MLKVKNLPAVTGLATVLVSCAITAKADTTLAFRAQTQRAEFSLPGREYDLASTYYTVNVSHRLDSRLTLRGFLGHRESEIDYESSATEADSDTLSFGVSGSYRIAGATFVGLAYSRGEGGTDVAASPSLAAYDFDSEYDAYTLSLGQGMQLADRLSAYVAVAYSHLESRRERFTSPSGGTVAEADQKKYVWTLSPALYYRTDNFTHFYRLSQSRSNVDTSGADDPKHLRNTLGTRYRLDNDYSWDISVSRVSGKAATDDTSFALGISKKL